MIKEFLILITIDVIFYTLAHASQQFVSPISRRMANVSFALWQVSLTENRSPLYKLEMVEEGNQILVAKKHRTKNIS